MASDNHQPMIGHFTDPRHELRQTLYSHDETGLCNICLLKLAGRRGFTYGCYFCNIHLHSACARYFQETISFFAHPAHTLKLRRSPGRRCDICWGHCPPSGSFVYSCLDCGFDVHPLCAMLPAETVVAASPVDPSHRLRVCMLSSDSPGNCSACNHPLPRWHYISSSVRLHIACAIDDTPTGAGGLHGSNGHAAIQGSYHDYGGAVVQGSHGAVGQQRSLFGAPAGQMNYGYFGSPVPTVTPACFNPGFQGYAPYYGPGMPGGSGEQQQSILYNPSSLMSVIARFLVGHAVGAVASELFSELLSSVSFN